MNEMNFETGLEPISEILGPSLKAGSKAPSADLFSTTLTTPARLHRTFRSALGAGQLPLVVIPGEFDLDDFFATVATYYPSQSPLTAHVYVLGKDVVKCFDSTQSNVVPDGRGLNRSQTARLGACLGETALAAINSVDGVLNPSYSTCKRSLSYTLARTVALYPSFDANQAADRWDRLRRLTGLPVSQVAVRAVRIVHAAASNGSARPDEGVIAEQLRSALETHMAAPNAGDVLQHVILEHYPGLRGIVSEIDGPFDARMNVFMKAVEEIQRATRGSETDSLAVGYFCNRILPGSFAHGKVLTRLVEFFPSALVWYGAFCSTSPSFDARNFGNGLFAKLGRDISQPFSFAQRPQCDLSLDELEVLMRAPVRTDAIKPIQQRIAAVALLPGIDVLSRFIPNEDSPSGKEPPSIKSGVYDERLTRATQLLDDAASLLHDLQSGRERITPPVSNSKRQRKR
ncbi:MAG: hypothetical protein Q8O00_07605 [Holophaga sp.]|nr:hypothetical protein [Holophaga sp.]